jgi:signal transduction histidine kinase
VARFISPQTWPLAAKIPLAVVALMMLVGVVLSERVLTRLTESQESHLSDLAQSYLDGLTSAISPAVLTGDTWEMFDAIERAETMNKSVRVMETVVTDADGKVIAASDPKMHRLGSTMQSYDVEAFSFVPGGDEARATRRISYPGRIIGIIHARFDTSQLAAERLFVLRTLIVTNGILTLVLASGGWLLVYRMMRPVQILTRHLGADNGGIPVPIEEAAVTRGEFGKVFKAYNAMAASIGEREILRGRLAEEERLASLGRLASTLAHEINNPLGGLFNALATLNSHGHQAMPRQRALGLLDRGLRGIRDVVQTALTLYRADAGRCLSGADIADLGLLVGPEARRRTVTLRIDATLPESLPLPSSPVRQALLNLLLNAVAVTPPGGHVRLDASVNGETFIAIIADQGPGLPQWAAEILTGKSNMQPLNKGGGVGLWATHRLITELAGTILVSTPKSNGTSITIMLPLSRTEEISNVA